MILVDYMVLFFSFMFLSVVIALIGTGILELYHRLSERGYL